MRSSLILASRSRSCDPGRVHEALYSYVNDNVYRYIRTSDDIKAVDDQMSELQTRSKIDEECLAGPSTSNDLWVFCPRFLESCTLCPFHLDTEIICILAQPKANIRLVTRTPPREHCTVVSNVNFIFPVCPQVSRHQTEQKTQRNSKVQEIFKLSIDIE